jgi:MoaD family protein
VITFSITGFLIDFTNGERQIRVASDHSNISAALEQLWSLHVGLRDRVVNEQGQLRQHVNIFLNSENVRRLESLETPLKDGDEITILPSVSGGSESMPSNPESTFQFFSAVKQGQCASARALLAADPQLINVKYDKATALHFAAIDNHRDLVDLLLQAGADLNARDDEFNMTPIGWANERGHMEMVIYLHGLGAEVDLYSAVAYGLTDRVKQILSADSSKINEKNHYGTPIHEASLWGHVELLKLLIENGADPNVRNRHGDTAVEIARKQLESNCAATPIVIASRRKEIEQGCREVKEILVSGYS